uniref:Oxysterol binding protein like 10 n=1 Tax=Podarcis muralis TaxID=64176 RepID=A0A670JYE0_PODMU
NSDHPSGKNIVKFSVLKSISLHPPHPHFCPHPLGILYLLEHGEEYVFTLPCAYLGGKVSILCAKSGYSATVTFHTKPFYGGKVHRVTAEVKHNPTNTIVCKAQGEWNGTLEFTYSNGETKIIDTTKLPIIRKKIRPIAKQGPFESRHLWQHVTNALREGNISAATDHKQLLEERQRVEERQRAISNTVWKPKYFIKEVTRLLLEWQSAFYFSFYNVV